MKKSTKKKDSITTKSPFVKMTRLLYNKYPDFARRIE